MAHNLLSNIQMKRIFLILFFIIFSKISLAEVYKWVDEKGVVHFTDDMMHIPEKYRPIMDKIDIPEWKVENKREGETTEKKKVGIYMDQLGRGEEYWRSKIGEWNKKLKAYQERVDHLKIKYNEIVNKINDSKSSVERANLRREKDQIKDEIEQYKNQIEEAKIMVEKKIPEEVELYQAKPEWIKQ